MLAAALPARSSAAVDGVQRIGVVVVTASVEPLASAPIVITTWLPVSTAVPAKRVVLDVVWLVRSCRSERLSWVVLAALKIDSVSAEALLLTRTVTARLEPFQPARIEPGAIASL